MMRTLGILGFAHSHVFSYLDAWRAHPEWEVTVGVGWDHDARRLAGVADRYGLATAETVEQLLADASIEAVLITAETALHAQLVEQAAAAGKAVILQKPMALTLDEADRIVNAVTRAAVPFTMAWQMRVDPQNLAIRDLVARATLGRLYMVRRRHSLNFCLDPQARQSWHTQRRWNRDLWADDAAHPFDFIYWLFGLPAAVTAELRALHDPETGIDNGIAILSYPDGPLVEIVCSFTTLAAENTVEMAGSEGMLIQNYGDAPSCGAPRPTDLPGLKWYTRAAAGWTASPLPSPTSQGERIAALALPLAEWLQRKRPALASAEEGRDVLRMLLATYVASRDGRRVALDDPAITALA